MPPTLPPLTQRRRNPNIGALHGRGGARSPPGGGSGAERHLRTYVDGDPGRTAGLTWFAGFRRTRGVACLYEEGPWVE
jgi:hypothetical protein